MESKGSFCGVQRVILWSPEGHSVESKGSFCGVQRVILWSPKGHFELKLKFVATCTKRSIMTTCDAYKYALCVDRL